jgi:methionyl-tRNA formyltransferase
VLKNKLRRFDMLGLANQGLLFLYRKIFESKKDEKAAKKIFVGKPNSFIERSDIDVLEVRDINCELVSDFLVSKAPRLVVVSGAPLLRRRVLQAAEGRIINLHPGYAPEYRGRYGCFWPIYNKEPDLVGTTIHFIDSGIDTGAILAQEKVRFNPDDTLKTITYRQHREGTVLMVRCLQQFDSLAVKAYHKTGCPSKNYLSIGLTHYLKGKRWLKRQGRFQTSMTSLD